MGSTSQMAARSLGLSGCCGVKSCTPRSATTLIICRCGKLATQQYRAAEKAALWRTDLNDRGPLNGAEGVVRPPQILTFSRCKFAAERRGFREDGGASDIGTVAPDGHSVRARSVAKFGAIFL